MYTSIGSWPIDSSGHAPQNRGWFRYFADFSSTLPSLSGDTLTSLYPTPVSPPSPVFNHDPRSFVYPLSFAVAAQRFPPLRDRWEEEGGRQRMTRWSPHRLAGRVERGGGDVRRGE